MFDKLLVIAVQVTAAPRSSKHSLSTPATNTRRLGGQKSHSGLRGFRPLGLACQRARALSQRAFEATPM